jgi:cytochrome c-type biogenesis protein CcmH
MISTLLVLMLLGAPQGTPLSGEPLETRTNEIAALVRCPVCQGMSIADSKSEMAINMKKRVHELLSQGYTEEQILADFEQSYGQFVLLKPKFEGVNALVWIVPVLAVIAGIVVVFRKLKPTANHQAPATTTDPYLAQVRKLTGVKP